METLRTQLEEYSRSHGEALHILHQDSFTRNDVFNYGMAISKATLKYNQLYTDLKEADLKVTAYIVDRDLEKAKSKALMEKHRKQAEEKFLLTNPDGDLVKFSKDWFEGLKDKSWNDIQAEVDGKKNKSVAINLRIDEETQKKVQEKIGDVIKISDYVRDLISKNLKLDAK